MFSVHVARKTYNPMYLLSCNYHLTALNRDITKFPHRTGRGLAKYHLPLENDQLMLPAYDDYVNQEELKTNNANYTLCPSNLGSI